MDSFRASLINLKNRRALYPRKIAPTSETSGAIFVMPVRHGAASAPLFYQAPGREAAIVLDNAEAQKPAQIIIEPRLAGFGQVRGGHDLTLT